MPTTRLGDWHVNLHLWRPQLIHCMNDRSTLSVLLPAKDSASFPLRMRFALSRLLLRLGAPRDAVQTEVAAMEEFALAPTNNRSILGCMTDAGFALRYAMESGKFHSLEDLEMHLTKHIHGPTGHIPPGELAIELLVKAGRA
jgi:hypothetical protein